VGPTRLPLRDSGSYKPAAAKKQRLRLACTDKKKTPAGLPAGVELLTKRSVAS